jgi:hypothetical protein
LECKERAVGKSGAIKITGEEKKIGNSQEVIMKPRATFGTTSGMNFFLVMKSTGPTNWKPVYKSEIKAHFGNGFEWNVVNLLTSDLVNDNNIDMAFKVEFYQS